MPKRSKEYSEPIVFNATEGSRELGAIAAKRAKYTNLSDYLREMLYALIEEQIPTEAERKQILELVSGPRPTQDTEDDTPETGPQARGVEYVSAGVPRYNRAERMAMLRQRAANG